MSEPVTYQNYLPVCSIPQNCNISKFMNFAPRDSLHGYHEFFASISGSFQDQPYLIRWLTIKMKARK